MIELTQYFKALQKFRPLPDAEKQKAIETPAKEPLFIVAGPGTGKTTVLTLRVLKIILVDGVPPRGIIATTFTRKAAEELRSRVLGWGFKLIDELKKLSLSKAQKEFIDKLDINQVWTGTIDSLCETILKEHRPPGEQPPVMADEYLSHTIMLREGLFKNDRLRDDNLNAFLLSIKQDRYNFNSGAKASLLIDLWDRRYQDQIDWQSFVKKAPKEIRPGVVLTDEIFNDYHAELNNQMMIDFALLEQNFLDQLRNNSLPEFTRDLQVIFVDEYQDTNLMQEQIYFELAKACKGSLVVVGDDDQSLYRFRGATVDLFRDFSQRYQKRFKKKPTQIFLSTNYRSTTNIIEFVNDYATLDKSYQSIRVDKKPPIQSPPKAQAGFPILGMFRDDLDTLAEDLSDFIYQVFRGKGYSLGKMGKVEKDPKGGDIGDCALLCSSPGEHSSSGNVRLPLLLREKLLNRPNPIEVFNPRGEDISNTYLIQLMGGLLLECLDPGGCVQQSTSGLYEGILDTFTNWRELANQYYDTANNKNFERFVEGWVNRDPGRKGARWPESTNVIDLLYGLVHFFPEFHDDPEGQVFLEVFTRQLAACEQLGSFGTRVVNNPANPGLSEASIRELLRLFLGPIASGAVQINEDLMETFPRDRLSILSIHQAKGLEFPLTIVDVGSDFRTNHHRTRFKRFPNDGGIPHRFEDLLRPFSALGSPSRSQTDRAFDDLYRQFFVAFSRPQDVLLLVGITHSFPGDRVPNVATGYDRTGNRHWDPDKPPFMMI